VVHYDHRPDRVFDLYSLCALKGVLKCSNPHLVKNFPLTKILFILTFVNANLVFMYESRQPLNGLARLSALLLCSTALFTSCMVCTVNKSVLEEKLKAKNEHPNYKGISLKSVSLVRKGKPYNNNIDTLECVDPVGKSKFKRFNYASKVTIVTKDKAVKVYAKSLYIWNDQFLIGERTTPNFRGGPNYFPVRLCDIARIEVKP
jgi:hypothetical protein